MAKSLSIRECEPMKTLPLLLFTLVGILFSEMPL